MSWEKSKRLLVRNDPSTLTEVLEKIVKVDGRRMKLTIKCRTFDVIPAHLREEFLDREERSMVRGQCLSSYGKGELHRLSLGVYSYKVTGLFKYVDKTTEADNPIIVQGESQ